MRRARPCGVLLLAAAALLIAGCGSSTTVTTTVTAASNSSSAQTSSSAPTATSTSSTTTATSSAGVPRCRAATLGLRFLGQQGATGHGELGFALRNTGSTSCHTFGYPGILFLSRSGSALPTIPTHTTHDFFGTAPEVGINLAPGHSASFRLGVTHGISSTAGCTTAYALQVIPPNDTATLRVAIPGGAYQCRTATVSPLQPGTSAFT